MTRRENDHEVLAVAVDLHAQDEAAREAERQRALTREAAAEVGVGPEHVAAAEVEVARRRARAAALRRRVALGVAGAFAVAVLGVAAWRASAPAPVTPWVERFAQRGRWSLDVSPGTVAGLAYEVEGGRAAAVVTVARASPRADGTWFVNLDGVGLPPIAGHAAVVLELAGTLPAARVYLEVGADERWRSPPVAVQPAWTRHRVPLAAFEHQRREGGRWRVVGGAAPSGVTTVSVKLGHYVNAPEAAGVVRVREVGVE